MEKLTDLFLSLGSNLGDRKKNIESAYVAIKNRIGEVVNKSSFFENEAIGFESENLFLNSCIKVRTAKAPLKVLYELQDIEREIGRTAKSIDGAYESRLIDIDIILFGNYVCKEEELYIPHKLFRNRIFVLFPLCEIGRNQIDPITQLTIGQLLEINRQ